MFSAAYSRKEGLKRQRSLTPGSPVVVGEPPVCIHCQPWLQCFLNVFSFNYLRCTVPVRDKKKKQDYTGWCSSCPSHSLFANT